MAPVTLPPSFFNSFWTPDYRSGLEVLFKQLDQVRQSYSQCATFVVLVSGDEMWAQLADSLL
jgi:hypothetical protein